MIMAKTIAEAASVNFVKNAKNGRRNIPRYLYHVTNQKNYQKILRDGFIKTGNDAAVESNLNGVFMFDLKNFTKRWCNMGFDIGDNPGEGFLTLAKGLFMKSSSETSDIVVLRIPTKLLSLDKLRCRVQGGINADISLSHVLDGDVATRQKHYTRKRRPIEYIFQENIPISGIQKAGEANTGVILEDMMKDDMSGLSLYKKINPKEILANLFKGQPEEKCIKLSNNSSIKFRNIFE